MLVKYKSDSVLIYSLFHSVWQNSGLMDKLGSFFFHNCSLIRNNAMLVCPHGKIMYIQHTQNLKHHSYMYFLQVRLNCLYLRILRYFLSTKSQLWKKKLPNLSIKPEFCVNHDLRTACKFNWNVYIFSPCIVS
jgi:hypothetical protein